MTKYHLEDIDVDRFARQWLEGLDSDTASSRGLLDHKGMGPYFMISNIGPQAVEPDSSTDELVLYAVLAAFQNADFSGRHEEVWDSFEGHLDAAFHYANAIGRTGVARSLLAGVVRRATRESGGFSDQLTAASLKNDPAQIAAHEQEMAHILDRDVRAAHLLDPRVSIDELILSPELED
ncbi:hypothetical protein FQ142_03930 [Microbacterium sp. ANT_H45B]|uniref:hypothetical protein n=1 Tax=Microbacterium sp. ANT_H45B TaxID=2597346 RepID=UPI0011EE9B54|nr:hypothetical protein [Microbacterium sp. ANT_H45B]KAA0962480.1 hypothetical protein FQ142_03930 [Microbacterium sp. ANT_H45B]